MDLPSYLSGYVDSVQALVEKVIPHFEGTPHALLQANGFRDLRPSLPDGG